MREIKFRGKTLKTNKWVYGSFVKATRNWDNNKKFHKEWIVYNAFSNGGYFNVQGRVAVASDTVGQFTGLKDENGVEIYEDDIIVAKYNNQYICDVKGIIVFSNGQWSVEYVLKHLLYDLNNFSNIKVIGNIHENYELLED